MHAVIAHQGGWDEILMLLVPALVIAALFALLEVRARRRERERGEG